MSEHTVKINQNVLVSINSKPAQRFTVTYKDDVLIRMVANELGDEVYNIAMRLLPASASESDRQQMDFKRL